MAVNFTGSLAISGSLVVSGSIFTSGSITISGSISSASYAATLQGLGSASFASASVFNTVSSSYASASGSLSSRVTLIEGQYATTGSNNFTKPQQISDVSNAISFTSTASLYTAGGLRVGKDSFVSGTAYFNNVVVYGTSSIQYITSSQVNIGTNIITVNTDTPAVRFGGLAVFDSGSTALTGSLLWDSLNNRWIYSNPSGSTYDGGMLISGPRNTTGLGNEVGTTACAVMIGQGGDHITSSGIFSYSNATCFYGNSFISSSGATCFGGNITGPNFYIQAASAGTYGLADLTAAMQTYGGGSPACSILFYTCGVERMRFTSTGVACFANTVCSPILSANSGYFSSQICSTGNSNTFGTAGSTGRAVIVQAGSTNQAIQLKNSSGGDGTISATGGATSMNYSFSTYQCSDVFFICNNGFVGVGTTSPKSYSALTVNGQIIGINNIGVDAGQSYRLNNYYNSGTVTDRTISNGYAASIGLDNSNGGMTFNVSSTCVAADNNITTPERFRITGAGIACFACQVCAPSVVATSFEVGNGQYYTARRSSGNLLINLLGIESSTDDTRLLITGDFNVTNGSLLKVFTVKNAGNVGIGACNPQQILSVNNPFSSLNALYPIAISQYSTTEMGGIYSTADSITNPIGAGLAFKVYQQNVGLVEKLRITNSGVACFTSTVCSPFIVTNTIEMGGSATSPSLACVGYGMFGYSGVGLGIAAGATGGNQGMGFFTCGNNERMRIITNGNVGIGNVCPGARLQVKASAAAGATDALYIENSSATSLFQVRDDGLTYMRGNVGINISTPCSQLDVRGTITNSCTAGNRNYTIDTAHAKISIASGGYVDFCSMSGMVLVNNWTNGAVTAFLVGGGSTAVMGTVTGTAGAMFYNSTTAGYRWCETLGSTANYGFQVFRTRDTA